MFALIASLYTALIYRPLLNILVFFYKTIALHDLGVSIILLTLLVRVILYPIFAKSARHNLIMQKLQPHIKKIQEEHKRDKTKQGQAMMDLYREHKVNPLTAIGLIFAQLPVLIALFQISRAIFKPETLASLYGFVSAPGSINNLLLGLINLSEQNILIVALAAYAQYVQAKLSLPKTEPGKELTPTERVGRQMLYVGPALTIVFLLNLPSALGLYWLTTSIFSVFQQKAISKQLEGDGPIVSKK